ncbi:hypothetical protein [Nocardia jinanensis]|uniref:Uncharacterized protein n=1 Tax=Nocardia jinanensis TaxID=382504 RepID=A0A917VNP1_9NOCA|nr:hypothetical protein GCM10011588_12330 [Nocardia jinanensis]
MVSTWAALTLAEEGTQIADAQPGVSDETWARIREHYDDDQIAARRMWSP